jgi:hypothetical protein
MIDLFWFSFYCFIFYLMFECVRIGLGWESDR